MVQDPVACPKCKQQMRKGFLLDRAHGGAGVMSWIEGKPRRSFWFGLKVTRRTTLVPLTAYRCPSCGYLESYAE